MWFFWILFFILLIALINSKGSPETEEKLRKQKNIEINRNIRVKKRYKDSSERKDLIRKVILIIIALFIFLWIGTVNNFNVPTILVGTIVGIFFIIKKIFQASKIDRQIYKEELALDKKEEEKEKKLKEEEKRKHYYANSPTEEEFLERRTRTEADTENEDKVRELEERIDNLESDLEGKIIF